MSITRIVTHDRAFHADDVLATAICMLLWPNAEINRTRQKQDLDPKTLVLDVGGVYDPENNLFDHHQQSFKTARDWAPNVAYSSAGLIWLHFGRVVLESVFNVPSNHIEKIWQHLDKEFVYPVDCVDNGVAVGGPKAFQYSYLISSLNIERALPFDDQIQLDLFKNAVSITQQFLKGMIGDRLFSLQSEDIVEKCYQQRTVSTLVEVPQGIDGIAYLATKPEVLFCIYPRKDGSWCAQAIPPTPEDAFAQRMPFPAAWAGLMDEELDKATGVTGGIFCHKSGFLLIANSKASLLEILKDMGL